MHIKNTQSMNILCILVMLLSFTSVKLDLPIQCLVSDIKGTWIFSIDSKSFSPSLKDEQTTCGRGYPGKVEQNIGEQDYYPFPGTEKLTLDLRDDYKVYENGAYAGTWTPIYSQGFLIYYHDSILTSSYKYYKKTKDDEEFTYDCGKTMIGWIIRNKNNLQANWSCFHAKKLGQTKKGMMALIQTQSVAQIGNGNRNRNENKNKSVVQMKKPTLFENHIKYEELEPMVKEINNAGLTWKAEIYPTFKGMTIAKMKSELGLNNKNNYHSKEEHQEQGIKQNLVQKSHFLSGKQKSRNKQHHMSMIQTTSENKYYDSYQDFLHDFNSEDKATMTKAEKEEETVWEDKNAQEKRIENDGQRDKDSNEVFDFDEITKYVDTPVDQIDENKIAKNWDWRNAGGIDYIGPAESQGSCGSCYVFSTVRSLESRLRIKTHNKDKTEFSIQFPVSCNFYSEGCHGGFPILLAKFLAEFELVPKECFAYTQSNGKCSDVCDYTKYSKKYIVSDYGYLGGFYGGTSEADMMKEIRARGPIPGNMVVPTSFNYYRNGIFSTKELKTNSNKINKWRMVDNKIYFSKVEHSITLVGYGEENGVKYWIGMNTWGPYWGENGFFRIIRGENESNIETMGDYFNIKVLDRN